MSLVPVETVVAPAILEEFEGLSLDELAALLRVEHQAVGSAMGRALGHAMKCGRVCAVAKQKILVEAAGTLSQFQMWAEDAGIKSATARQYMRLAYYAEILPDGIGIADASDYLQGLPATDGRRVIQGYPEAVKVEARRRRQNGETLRAIGKSLGGIPEATVYRWCTGKRGRDKERDLQRRRALERIARREEKREEAAKRARERGGSISAAYSLLRRLAQELDAARAESGDREVRKALNRSLVSVHAAETSLCEALGVDYGSWRSGRRV